MLKSIVLDSFPSIRQSGAELRLGCLDVNADKNIAKQTDRYLVSDKHHKIA